jgi:hypothetical protein
MSFGSPKHIEIGQSSSWPLAFVASAYCKYADFFFDITMTHIYAGDLNSLSHGVVAFALCEIQRPRGKRDWIVLDENGLQREVNKYEITFQWYIPELEASLVGSQAKAKHKPKFTTDELRALRAEIEAIRDSAAMTKEDVTAVWKILLKKYGKRQQIEYEDVARLVFNRSFF